MNSGDSKIICNKRDFQYRVTEKVSTNETTNGNHSTKSTANTTWLLLKVQDYKQNTYYKRSKPNHYMVQYKRMMLI